MSKFGANEEKLCNGIPCEIDLEDSYKFWKKEDFVDYDTVIQNERVCVYVYMYVCIYAHVCIYVYVYMGICVNVCVRLK